MKFRKLINRLDRVLDTDMQGTVETEELDKLHRALQHKKHKYKNRLENLDETDDRRSRTITRLGIVDDQLARVRRLIDDASLTGRDSA